MREREKKRRERKREIQESRWPIALSCAFLISERDTQTNHNFLRLIKLSSPHEADYLQLFFKLLDRNETKRFSHQTRSLISRKKGVCLRVIHSPEFHYLKN